MVRSLAHFCIAATIFGAVLSTTACLGSDRGQQENQANPRECGDCIQPPLLREDLIPHLQENQERILARADYMLDLPPPVSEIIYGPVPTEPLRDGPPVMNVDGEPFDGELSWHYTEFDDVITDGADHDSLRGRNVSGAHCFFAHKPNRFTAIFALLVLHHRDRGDVLYLGGPHHEVSRLDTVPITDRYSSRIRVKTDYLHCAFRGDQNRMGALVIPFEPIDRHHADNPHYAVFTVITAEQRRDTAEMRTIERAAGSRDREAVEEDVHVRKYPTPRPEFVDVFADLHDALVAAEESIPRGNFRLRPEFVYPTMAWQSYLDTGEEEFCPNYTQCEEERQHFDADIVPPLPVIEEEETDAEEASDEGTADEEEEAGDEEAGDEEQAPQA